MIDISQIEQVGDTVEYHSRKYGPLVCKVLKRHAGGRLTLETVRETLHVPLLKKFVAMDHYCTVLKKGKQACQFTTQALPISEPI